MSGKKCNNPTCNGAFCQGSRPGTIRACPVCNVPNESQRSQAMSQPEHEGPYSVHPDGFAVTYRDEDDGGVSFLTSNHSLQDWCDELNEAYNRGASEISDLTAERDALKERVKELEEALMWCSGSDDFAPGGKARTGWEMIVGNMLAKHEGEKP